MNTMLNASFTGMDVRIDFTYDYLGRRVAKSVWDYNLNTQTLYQRYLYDGSDLIAQTDASRNLQRTFTWGLDLAGSRSATGGVSALLQINDLTAGKTLSLTYDGNGNVAGLVNSDSGVLEGAYEYDPSGNLLRCEGAYAKSNPFRFSTKWQDDESGLINHGFRYYSPTFGRFINRDPIAEKGGLNLYGFCGNNGINGIDVLGRGNFFEDIGHALSSFWDHTFLWLGKHIAQNWDHGRRYVEIAAVIVASVFVGEEVDGLVQGMFDSAAEAAGDAATETALASGAPAMAAEEAGSMAMTDSLAGLGGIPTMAGGAAAGFTSGAMSAAFAGGNLNQVLSAGATGAAWGATFAFAGYEILNAHFPTHFSWSDARNALVTSAARYEIGRFAQREFGINGWQFDAALEAISYVGYHLFGNPYDDYNKKGGFYYIGGFGDRNPATGLLFKGGGMAHYWGEFLFDVNDQLLQWQGLPDAEGIRYAYHGLSLPYYGHSLGASRLVTLASLGIINGGGGAIALPFGEVASGGVETFIGNGDIVTGSYLGVGFNPDANVGSVHFITGHALDAYVDAFPQNL